MPYEAKPGDATVFRETDKRSDKAPDWKGTVIIPHDAQSGEKMEIAFWSKDGRKGQFLSGRVSKLRARPDQRQSSPRRDDRDYRDDMPF